MKEWEKLCSYFSLIENFVPHEEYTKLFNTEDEEEEEDGGATEENSDEEIFEVSKVHDVRYDDAKNETGPGLYFKVFYDYFVYFFHLILKLLLFFIYTLILNILYFFVIN